MPHKDREERLAYLRRWKERNRPSPTVEEQRDPTLPPLGKMTFSGDGTMVQCHFCGVWKRSLNTHMREHGMTAAEYKEAAGLPRGASTNPPAFREKNRANALARDQGHRGQPFDGTTVRPSGLDARLGVRVEASEARKGIYTRGGHITRGSGE